MIILGSHSWLVVWDISASRCPWALVPAVLLWVLNIHAIATLELLSPQETGKRWWKLSLGKQVKVVHADYEASTLNRLVALLSPCAKLQR